MRYVVAVAVWLFALLTVTAYAGDALKRMSVGDPVKDFALETTGGESLRLSNSLARKATLVVFWATWSPRSSEALTDFQELYAIHGPDDLQVVAVNVEHQDWDPALVDSVMTYMDDRALGFPVLFDKDLSVFNDWGVIAVPSTVLADASGRVVEILEGYSYMTRFDFRDRVLELLGVLRPEGRDGPEAEAAYKPKGKASRYYQMGELFLKKKQSRRALKAFQAAVEEDPDYADAHLRIASIFEADGLPEKAAEAKTRAAEAGTTPAPEVEQTQEAGPAAAPPLGREPSQNAEAR